MAVMLSGYRLRLAAVAVVFLLSTPSPGQDPAQLALERALRLADVYNWSDAAPFFAEAERLFVSLGDTRNAFYARVGLIRGTMEQRSLPEISNWLANELSANELLQAEDELRLFCLVVKGDIEGELDAGPMRRDWQAVLQLAQKLGNQKWVNRASGEIGFAAFLEGDLAEARNLVAGTLMHASKTGDVGAQIRYLAAIGTGLVLTRSPSESLPYFEKAAGLSKQHGDVGYPFLVHEGRVMALKALGRLADARVEADRVLHQARSRQKHVKECQVLITSARISLAQNEYDRAASELDQAIKLADAGGFKRLLADAHAVLADVYIAKGDLPKAEAIASIAADLTQSSGELYLVPGRLELVARVKVLRGKHTEADRVYRHAADFVDAMLAKAPPSAKTSLIIAMSDIYAGHFALAAGKLNRPALAFEIVERARGRVTTDLIRTGMRETPDEAREVERQISELHLQLTGAKTRAEVRRIRDRIFLAEQSRWVLPNTWRDQVRQAAPVKLADLQRTLSPKDMLLEYVLAEPTSFCLTVTRDQVRIVTLPERSRIEALINDYVQAVKAKRAVHALGQRIHSALLGGVPGLRTHTRLIVVGDGYLHLLPFDPLVDTAGRFLVRTHTVTTATSATAPYLQGDDGHPGLYGNSILAVGGIPYETGTTPKIALFRRGSGGALGNLPNFGG
jgi:tetratricopeptide (TPR) repeat protein